MKLITLKPLFLGGTVVVEGKPFETIEQHGRELIKKGYAELDDSDAEPVVKLAEDSAAAAPAFTSDQLVPTQLSPDAAPLGDLLAPPAADAPDASDLLAPSVADAPDATQKPVTSKKKAS